MMAKKLPYFPFYPGDWLKDDALTLCAPATRGIWIDLIARMHERDRSGELRGTAEQLARAARCSTVELVSCVTDLSATGTAEVTERNGEFLVRNRRMYAESQARKSNAERQSRFRNGDSNGNKAPPSEYVYETEFEDFWKAFPSGRKKSKATARDSFAKAAKKCDPATIIASATDYANSPAGRGQFVKMPSTWLNQECWLDDPASWRDHDAPQTDGGYRAITREEFAEHWKMQRFKEKPTRHASNPNWVFGTLRSGVKVECKDFSK